MNSLKNTLTRLGGGATLALVSAQTAVAAQAQGVPNPVNNNDLGGVLFSVVNFLLLFAGAIAVLFLIIGGFRYVVSTGNPEQVEGAKKTILYAVLGLVIIFIAWVLVSLVQDWLGVKSGFQINQSS